MLCGARAKQNHLRERRAGRHGADADKDDGARASDDPVRAVPVQHRPGQRRPQKISQPFGGKDGAYAGGRAGELVHQRRADWPEDVDRQAGEEQDHAVDGGRAGTVPWTCFGQHGDRAPFGAPRGVYLWSLAPPRAGHRRAEEAAAGMSSPSGLVAACVGFVVVPAVVLSSLSFATLHTIEYGLDFNAITMNLRSTLALP